METPTGTIALKKTSEDGVVEGISFTIKGENYRKTVETDANGNMTVEDLFPGTYTVTEQPIDHYEQPKTQTVGRQIEGDANSELFFRHLSY